MKIEDALNIFGLKELYHCEYFIEEAEKILVIEDLNMYYNNHFIKFCLLLCAIEDLKNEPKVLRYEDSVLRKDKRKDQNKKIFFALETDYITIQHILNELEKETIESFYNLASKYIFFEKNGLDVYEKNHQKMFEINNEV